MDDYKETIGRLSSQVELLRAENLQLTSDMVSFKNDHEVQKSQFESMKKKNEDLVMENLTLKDILYEKDKSVTTAVMAARESKLASHDLFNRFNNSTNMTGPTASRLYLARNTSPLRTHASLPTNPQTANLQPSHIHPETVAENAKKEQSP